MHLNSDSGVNFSSFQLCCISIGWLNWCIITPSIPAVSQFLFWDTGRDESLLNINGAEGESISAVWKSVFEHVTGGVAAATRHSTRN